MNLSIKMKLVLLCGLGLSLVAAVLLVGSYFNRHISMAHREQVEILHANEQVQQARIAEKAYLQFYKAEFIQERSSKSNLAEKSYDEVAARGELDISGLKSQLLEYDSAFAGLVEMHMQNEILGQKMDATLEKITNLVTVVEDEIQSQLFDLQMEGETLPDAENNLLSLTRDGKIMALTMKNSYRAFLLSGDKSHLVALDKFIKERGAVTISGLTQFSAQTGKSTFVSAAEGFKVGITEGQSLLEKSQALFDQEIAAGENLNTIGDALMIQADELLAASTVMGENAENTSVTTIIILTVFGALSFLVISFLLNRSITRPLGKALILADTIRSGDLSQRLNMQSADEIGQLGKALDQMADSLETKADLARKIADGDLTVEVVLASEQDQLGIALRRMVENLNELMSNVATAGDQIASGSNEISSSSQDLSHGATTQAASMEEISASMGEMSSQTRQNAENAGQADCLSTEAKEAAERGSSQMTEMVRAMGEINDAGQNISKIIKVIDEIAFQTNLLALNAAVEAARAGQHGKGFAVVAEEVRNLAARSAKAAQETSELIEGSVDKTTRGTQVANRTAEVLDEIVGGITKVSDLVKEISVASNEQAQGISEVTAGLDQIDQVTQQNTAAAEESAAAAETLSSQAMHLQQMLSQFKLKGVAQQLAPVEEYRPATQRTEPHQVGWSHLQPDINLDESV